MAKDRHTHRKVRSKRKVAARKPTPAKGMDAEIDRLEAVINQITSAVERSSLAAVTFDQQIDRALVQLGLDRSNPLVIRGVNRVKLRSLAKRLIAPAANHEANRRWAGVLLNLPGPIPKTTYYRLRRTIREAYCRANGYALDE